MARQTAHGPNSFSICRLQCKPLKTKSPAGSPQGFLVYFNFRNSVATLVFLTKTSIGVARDPGIPSSRAP